MNQLQDLPIGIQYFADLRKGNCVYVDKTEYIYKICSPPNRPYFLSRPRRFGKSLTLDTISELFQGNRALFEGLWIEDKWDWTQTYPIIRLSLDSIGHEDGGLKYALVVALQEVADEFEITLVSKSPAVAFKELIKKVAKQTGKQVVVLVDEYDKPIIDYIDPYNLKKAQSQRDILKSFFGILKQASKDIRMLFITGVSKFARVSIFSELNHLVDLTLHPDFVGLCGYTEEELTHYFQGYFQQMPANTLDKMRVWYNGYSWDGKISVYNPYSVLNFFSTKNYGNYWFATDTPTFLVKVLRHRFWYQLERVEVSDLILDVFILEEIGHLNITSLLLQTGYLTIKEINPHGKFVLNYPNEEVKRSFGQFLLREYTPTSLEVPYAANILEALENNNIARVMAILHDLIQAVPDQNYVKDEEKFIHAIVHLIFTMVGTDVHSEVHTPAGRIDTLVITEERIFLFEFKTSGTPEEAIQCIHDRNYAAHLRHRNKPITGIGVVFSRAKKGVESWDKAEL